MSAALINIAHSRFEVTPEAQKLQHALMGEMKVVCILAQDTYKPGDLPPDGLLAWNEWAEVQYKAGIKQVQCGKCGKWKTPQELMSDQSMRWTAHSRRKGPVEMTLPVCRKCSVQMELRGEISG